MKQGTQVLNNGALVYVGKDREGLYFTMHTNGSGQKIRLIAHAGVWKYTLPGFNQVHLALFTDPSKKPHP